MFSWLRRKKPVSLKDHLKTTKRLIVCGVIFDIRKIAVMDYLEGAKVLHEMFSVYKTKDQKVIDEKTINSIKKAKEYMRDVIMAGVVKPKLVRKLEDDQEGILVDDLFEDWMLAQELTTEILEYTYGKKK